jgi:hypothetical protein
VDDDVVSQGKSSTQTLLSKRYCVASLHDNADEEMLGEALVTASAGSNENLDHCGEDLMRSRQSRETGYVGQNSEVQWLSSVQRQVEYVGAEPRDQSSACGPPGTGRNDVSASSDALHEHRKNASEYDGQASSRTITDATFYLDSDEINFNTVVDLYENPEADTAKRLFECYMETVHQSFPLVSHSPRWKP